MAMPVSTTVVETIPRDEGVVMKLLVTMDDGSIWIGVTDAVVTGHPNQFKELRFNFMRPY
jgi:hypothetical protein